MKHIYDNFRHKIERYLSLNNIYGLRKEYEKLSKIIKKVADRVSEMMNWKRDHYKNFGVRWILNKSSSKEELFRNFRLYIEGLIICDVIESLLYLIDENEAPHRLFILETMMIDKLKNKNLIGKDYGKDSEIMAELIYYVNNDFSENKKKVNFIKKWVIEDCIKILMKEMEDEVTTLERHVDNLLNILYDDYLMDKHLGKDLLNDLFGYFILRKNRGISIDALQKNMKRDLIAQGLDFSRYRNEMELSEAMQLILNPFKEIFQIRWLDFDKYIYNEVEERLVKIMNFFGRYS